MLGNRERTDGAALGGRNPGVLPQVRGDFALDALRHAGELDDDLAFHVEAAECVDASCRSTMP